MGTFLDRRDAGRRLAEQLLPFRDADPVVIALPRGGAPVGDEIARALEAPLDVLVARKLGAPGNPELAIGAIAPGVVHLEPETIRALAVSEDYIRKAVAVEQEELRRRELRFREGRPALPVSGRTVILVDDALAPGATAVAAIEGLKIIEDLMESNHQLIANRNALKDPWKRAEIDQVSLLMQAVLRAEAQVGIKLNVRKANLENVIKLLPSITAPTLPDLYRTEWASVESVIAEAVVRDLIPKLVAAGAVGIIEYPLNKVM